MYKFCYYQSWIIYKVIDKLNYYNIFMQFSFLLYFMMMYNYLVVGMYIIKYYVLFNVFVIKNLVCINVQVYVIFVNNIVCNILKMIIEFKDFVFFFE